MPKLSHTLTVNNPNTNVINDIKLEGLRLFSHKYGPMKILSHTLKQILP